MSWISLILALLKLANNLYSWAHDNGKIKEGEERQILKASMEIAKRSKLAKEIDDRFAHATPEEVEKELEKDFRD